MRAPHSVKFFTTTLYVELKFIHMAFKWEFMECIVNSARVSHEGFHIREKIKKLFKVPT